MAVEFGWVQEQVTACGLGWQPGETAHYRSSLMRIRAGPERSRRRGSGC